MSDVDLNITFAGARWGLSDGTHTISILIGDYVMPKMQMLRHPAGGIILDTDLNETTHNLKFDRLIDWKLFVECINKCDDSVSATQKKHPNFPHEDKTNE